jgi:hypothetical protein
LRARKFSRAGQLVASHGRLVLGTLEHLTQKLALRAAAEEPHAASRL